MKFSLLSAVILAASLTASAQSVVYRVETSATTDLTTVPAHTAPPDADMGPAPRPTADESTTGLLRLSTSFQRMLGEIGMTATDFFKFTLSPEQPESEKRSVSAKRHFFYGQYLLQMDQPVHALGEFRAALEEEPGNERILLAIADAQAATRDYAGARKTLDDVLTSSPTNVAAIIRKARLLVERGEQTGGSERQKLIQQGIEAYKKALEIQPRNVEALRGLATAYFAVQDGDAIVDTYRKLVELNPRDTHAVLVLANVLARTGRKQEALPYFQRVVEQRRGFVQGYIYLAQLYYDLNRPSDALRTFKDAILIEPRNEELIRRFDLLLEEIAKRPGSQSPLKHYERFAREYPHSAEIQRLYAEKLIAAKKLDLALPQYRKVLKLEPDSPETLLAVGRLHLLRGEFSEALELFGKAVEIDPERIEVYDAIATSLLNQKNQADAIKTYQQAIKANPQAQRLYLSLALLLEQNQRYDEALDTLRQALEKGDILEAYVLMGQILDTTGKPDEALAAFHKAHAIAPTNAGVLVRIIGLNLRLGRDDAARDFITSAAAAFEDRKADFRALVGDTYYADGRTSEAAAEYEQALAFDPKRFATIVRLVQVYNALGRAADSLALLDRSRPAFGSQEDFLRLYVDAHLAAKDNDKAVEAARQLVEAHPSSINAYRVLVDTLNRAKRFDEARPALARAAAKLGQSEELESLEAISLYQQKRYPEAERRLRDLAKRGSKNADVYWYFLGSVHLDQKRFDAAETAFRKAIELNPNNDSALNALGYMFADNNVKLDEAEDLIRRALQLNPAAPHILDSMGWVLFRKGQLKEALEYVEKAHRLMGDDAEILEHLGDIHAALGNRERAVEYWQRSLAVDANQQDVRDKIATSSR
jgi:tetratricopeptide (TPR) repeat protein